VSGEITPPPIPTVIPRDTSVRYPVDAAVASGAELARDVRVGRAVVVKRMTGPLTSEATERFVREARLQGRLEHPAIVPVLDVGVDPDGRPYFVMREVRGTTLAEIVAERAGGNGERWSTRRLLAAFVDVCLAIEYAHRRGVVHRDLRPEHVLLGDFGEVYVLEWGRARLLDEPPSPRLPGGSLPPDGGRAGYAAPELLLGTSDVDGRADVYALGCLLFELLCSRPLHDPERAVESTIEGADVHAAARAVGRHGPPELLDACVAATRPRDARTPSARALADAVQRWLDGVRDLARRRELAARYRARARTAIGSGDRAVAMREAAAAVALSPDAGATELLGRLILEPPAEGSPEAEAIEEASDVAEIRAQARVAAVSFVAIPAFLPLLFWLGVVEPAIVVAIAALGLFQAGFAFAAGRGAVPVRLWVWGAFALNLVLLAVFTRVFSPVIAVPAMAITLTTAGVTLPGVRGLWIVPCLLAMSLFGPALLEAADVLASTTTATGTSLVIHSAVVHLPRGPTLIVLAVHTIALLLVGVNYGRQLTRVNREARLRLRAQAWHLEQIVESRSQS